MTPVRFLALMQFLGGMASTYPARQKNVRE
jgi:hypothetical protein